ncbi:hypothetical protein GQ457_11G025080 [Hibiscus cannabinus]
MLLKFYRNTRIICRRCNRHKTTYVATKEAIPHQSKEANNIFNNSLSVRAQGEWKPLFLATAYPFGFKENGNLYFQQQSIPSGSRRMETFYF